MIRYLFSIGLGITCLGLPAQAKDITPSLPAPSALRIKDGNKSKDADKKSASKSDKKSDCKTASTPPPAKKEAAPSTARKSPSSTLAKTSSSKPSTSKSTASKAKSSGRLARVTAYWAGEGDYYTGHGLSSTGVRLHEGHCAVDPHVIPYGSVVKIAGVGTYIAVDTGSAVISREAARQTGHTAEERNALVVDLYFERGSEGRKFAANGPKYASITWESPRSADNEPKNSRNLYAEENTEKAHSKQL